MAKKFLTTDEVLEYMNSLSNEEFDDTEMTIPLEPDAVSDKEEVNDSFTNCNIDKPCGDREILDTAGTIQVSHFCEEIRIETNRFAAQAKDPPFEVNESDIKEFIGILFYSANHILSRKKMYWENAPNTGTTSMNRAMSSKQFVT
ncbi:hypothetical protein HNY73_005205 [Argiope bruennichi]|uniref:PiggyBac transposable element-derived protein domain-containing protein n=1 Tax=Argiope bruennichi TaxID=94029 RepID=A0A8T0FIV5_ARGBR|nr:hypothetical protein HNY73_005205 [Argiope bruennichi]